MGKTTDVGMPTDFAFSMAAHIEAVFDTVCQAEGMPPLSLGTNTVSDRDRRLIFVAIAQGVVEYLVAHLDAFVFTDPGGNTVPIALTIIQADPL